MPCQCIQVDVDTKEKGKSAEGRSGDSNLVNALRKLRLRCLEPAQTRQLHCSRPEKACWSRTTMKMKIQ